MTTITQTTYNITCKVCDATIKLCKNVLVAFMVGRQRAANVQVARELHQLGFYGRDADYQHILMELNDKTTAEFEKRS